MSPVVHQYYLPFVDFGGRGDRHKPAMIPYIKGAFPERYCRFDAESIWLEGAPPDCGGLGNGPRSIVIMYRPIRG